jgi:hypothetical protein
MIDAFAKRHSEVLIREELMEEVVDLSRAMGLLMEAGRPETRHPFDCPCRQTTHVPSLQVLMSVWVGSDRPRHAVLDLLGTCGPTAWHRSTDGLAVFACVPQGAPGLPRHGCRPLVHVAELSCGDDALTTHAARVVAQSDAQRKLFVTTVQQRCSNPMMIAGGLAADLQAAGLGTEEIGCVVFQNVERFVSGWILAAGEATDVELDW